MREYDYGVPFRLWSATRFCSTRKACWSRCVEIVEDSNLRQPPPPPWARQAVTVRTLAWREGRMMPSLYIARGRPR